MTSYKIIVEDMMCNKCAMKIRQALEKLGDVAVSANVSKHEIIVDSDVSVADLYKAIEDAGYTPSDCELV